MNKHKSNNNNHVELLAPAGSPEKMKTAFLYGADAVYLGIPDFSLRVRINDFTINDIKKGVAFAHQNGKKVFVTVNIFAHNQHLKKLLDHIKKLKEIEIDALIVSDPGILEIIKQEWPEAKIHLSTQANCTNWRAVQFWQKQGVGRIILGREVSLGEIKEIRRRCPGMELEYFVHGAMCMAYSGRCFLSKYFLNRSSNLGDCVQPCRWKYSIKDFSVFINEEKRPSEELELVTEAHGSYILNSKNLCLIEYLGELMAAGVNSFKIEGRAKSIYYVATVVGAYRQGINYLIHRTKQTIKGNKIAYLKKELETKLVHRGYTSGFLLGGKGEELVSKSHENPDWEFCGQVISSEKLKNKFIIKVKVHNTIKVGDKIEIIKPFYDIIKLNLTDMVDEKNNKNIFEAHGGGSQVVLFKVNKDLPVGSVLRRKKAG